MSNVFVFIDAPVQSCLLVLGLVEAVGEAALPAVVTVKVTRHEDAGAAFVSGTFASQPVDFTILIDLETEDESGRSSTDRFLSEMWQTEAVTFVYLVVFEHSQLDLLPLVLVLLGGGVGLLLPLLGTTTQPQHKVQRRLLRRNGDS